MCRCVLGGPVGLEREPGCGVGGGEAGVGGVEPEHGRAFGVAAGGWVVLRGGVADLLRADGDVAHTELVAVVERGRAAQREQQHGRGARLHRADARGEARLVVVAEDVVGPGAGGEQRLVGADDLRDGGGFPLGLYEVEVEGEVRAGVLVRAVVADEMREREVDFADEEAG